MSRNGSGQYIAPINSWNPATNGQLASAGDWQTTLNDIVAALTQSLSRDGQGGMLGNLPMGGNKITGLGDGTGSGQALTFSQLFDQGTEQDLASAATTDIGAQLTNFLRITGTTTITSFGTNYKGPRFLRFAGAVTLTNSSTLVLPNGANITTAAGDCCIVIPKATLGTSDGWVVVAYSGSAAIPNSSVTYAKIQNVTAGKILGRDTSGAGVVQELPIAVNSDGAVAIGGPTIADVLTVNVNTQNGKGIAILNANNSAYATFQVNGQTGNGIPNWPGSLVIEASPQNGGGLTLSSYTGQLSLQTNSRTTGAALDANSNFKFNSGYGSVATAYGCRAWVNFDGTGAVGGKAVRASGGISSVVKNSTGDYTVNFATAMPDTNYAFIGQNGFQVGDSSVACVVQTAITPLSTTSCRFYVMSSNNTVLGDGKNIHVSFFR